MPIRRLTIHACAYGVILTCSAQVQSDVSLWNGSYAADGSCYCVGEQSRYIDSQIMPTPVGGQSVAQICERVGDGPSLRQINNKFNYTVYPDAQCGNGPFPKSAMTEYKGCEGHHPGESSEDCAPRGPRWNLTYAYSKEANNLADNSQFSAFTGGSRHIEPPVKKVFDANRKKQSVADTSIAEIVRTRSNAKKIRRATTKVAVPETSEQIRARQLVHLVAARERARLAASAQLKTASDPVEVAKKASVESVADTAKTPSVKNDTPTTLVAVKLPSELKYADPEFNYIEAAPVSFDFGGAGVSVAASMSSHDRMQYVLTASAAETYQEAAFGVGLFLNPGVASRTTLMVRAGLEYGSLHFQNTVAKATHSDTGVFAAMAARIAFTRKFEMQAGVSYSSFFEGDLVGLGAAFYHLTPRLDLTAKTEIGDNDLIGFGIRYHY